MKQMPPSPLMPPISFLQPCLLDRRVPLPVPHSHHPIRFIVSDAELSINGMPGGLHAETSSWDQAP